MRLGIVLGITLGGVVLLVVLMSVVGRARGYDYGRESVMRCSAGHLFTELLIPGVSFRAVRLGVARYERCPVGRHWAICRPQRREDLSPDEIAEAEAHRASRLP